ncbi:MAG: preprotein translocase subunit SecE [Myxococcales bacterium]|nr:preprotein translocase subunit SecE [Myxococcales bacterium]MCB9643437.1 preprotein translocase subunit SecE [Myxococcales bacterium]
MDKHRRWVVLAFLGLGLLAAWVLGEAFKSLFYYSRQYGFRDYVLLTESFTLANLLGLIVAVLLALRFWYNEEVNKAAHEVVDEMYRVTWPTGKDTQTSTIVVIVTTVIFSFFLWFFDQLWSWATTFIYRI